MNKQRRHFADHEKVAILKRHLVDEVKNRIFGLNAARLFNLDPTAQRHAIRTDRLTQLREEYQRDPYPSNRQFGWVWIEDGQEPTVPVGETV